MTNLEKRSLMRKIEKRMMMRKLVCLFFVGWSFVGRRMMMKNLEKRSLMRKIQKRMMMRKLFCFLFFFDFDYELYSKKRMMVRLGWRLSHLLDLLCCVCFQS